ncbi:MAG: hypothetical protein JO107_09340, partial [Hyphomicrobiales bacterium]|nr:hypothetical protein [Hyphomicrobiales bacterium]
MLVKRPLILVALSVAAVSAVHSQSLNGGEPGAQAPAPLFAGAAPDNPAGKQPPGSASDLLASLGGARRPANAAPSAQPWTLDLPTQAAASPDGRTNSAEAPIDLSALRYFAGENNLARVAAEIRLIRAKHPDWEPPPDLLSDSKGAELEGPMWDLFAKHDYEGVRRAMAQLQQSNPDYQPTSDLLGKLTLAEAEERLTQASDASQWGEVIETAAGAKMLMTCAYLDAMWRTAEALVRTDDEGRAIEAYRYILANC